MGRLPTAYFHHAIFLSKGCIEDTISFSGLFPGGPHLFPPPGTIIPKVSAMRFLRRVDFYMSRFLRRVDSYVESVPFRINHIASPLVTQSSDVTHQRSESAIMVALLLERRKGYIEIERSSSEGYQLLREYHEYSDIHDFKSMRRVDAAKAYGGTVGRGGHGTVGRGQGTTGSRSRR